MDEGNFAVMIIRCDKIGVIASGFVTDKRLGEMVVLVVQERHPFFQQRHLKRLVIQSVDGVAWLETSAPDGAENDDIVVFNWQYVRR